MAYTIQSQALVGRLRDLAADMEDGSCPPEFLVGIGEALSPVLDRIDKLMFAVHKRTFVHLKYLGKIKCSDTTLPKFRDDRWSFDLSKVTCPDCKAGN